MDPLPRYRVLIVDDDPAVLEAGRAALISAFDVEPLRSPSQSLVRLGEAEFHVVCAASRLPGTTGLELFERVRAVSRGSAFLLLCAPGEAAPEPPAQGGEMFSTLEKPIDAQRLARLVEQLARLAQIHRKLAAHARPGSRGTPAVASAARPRSPATPVVPPKGEPEPQK